MTEYNHAVRDLRRDVINEVLDAMPDDASGRELVDAIVARMRDGLPALVEVVVEVAK